MPQTDALGKLRRLVKYHEQDQKSGSVFATPFELLCWNGLEVSSSEVEARYNINYKSPIGVGAYGTVLKVGLPLLVI